MSEFKDHETPEQKCLACQHPLNRASSMVNDDAPVPGDVTLCIKCAHVMVFDENLKLREPREDEEVDIFTNREMQAIRDAIMSVEATDQRRS